jgi:lysophospholipase L1-like esterase
MVHDEYPSVALHNVAETGSPDWTDGGHTLHRLPASVRADLNPGARERYRHPAGCELRFVPEDGPVEVTLSAAAPTAVRPFWGDFQGREVTRLDTTPTTLELAVPERVRHLDAGRVDGRFAPQVCRLPFDFWERVAVHDVSGACRPPAADEVPDRRYLAYGTSITEGAAASEPHLSYVARTARLLGVDAVNLGSSGTAFCEPAVAEHVAGRDDWDCATLSVSVNMATREFDVETFRDRAATLVDRVAGSHPDCPVACVTLYPYRADLCTDCDPERAAAFRATFADVVAESSHDNLLLVSGPEVMDATGLTTDLLHPGDAGMEAIGRGLADRLAPLVS